MSDYPKRLQHPDSPGEAIAQNAADEEVLAAYGWKPADGLVAAVATGGGPGQAGAAVAGAVASQEPDLESMTKQQLIQYAELQEIKVDPRAKKEEIIAAIKEHRK